MANKMLFWLPAAVLAVTALLSPMSRVTAEDTPVLRAPQPSMADVMPAEWKSEALKGTIAENARAARQAFRNLRVLAAEPSAGATSADNDGPPASADDGEALAGTSHGATTSD